MLLCLVARRHCILTAANVTTAAAAGDVATAAVEGLQAEVETVCPLHAACFGLGIGAYMWLIRASDGSADCSADIRPARGRGPLPARYHARRARWWPTRQRGRHWHGYCHQRHCNRDDQTDALRFAAAVCRCLTPPHPRCVYAVQRAGGLIGAASGALRAQAQRLACDDTHGNGGGGGPLGSLHQHGQRHQPQAHRQRGCAARARDGRAARAGAGLGSLSTRPPPCRAD